jgi:hypothetical protein
MIKRRCKLFVLFGSEQKVLWLCHVSKTQQQQQQRQQVEHFDMYANPHYRHVTDVAEHSRLCRTQQTETDQHNFHTAIWQVFSDDVFIMILTQFTFLGLTVLAVVCVSSFLIGISECTIWGFHGGEYEECCLVGYKTPVRTSQETNNVSATEPSQVLLSKFWGFHGGDYEECRLLAYKMQYVPHGRHITSPLQSPAGHCYVRFEVFTAVTMTNVGFWDITPCASCKNRRFGRMYSLHHQGDKNRWTRNNASRN